jgi:hypothetical protein
MFFFLYINIIAMQVTYALGTVSKLVYLTIMYRKVKNIDYHKATAAV